MTRIAIMTRIVTTTVAAVLSTASVPAQTSNTTATASSVTRLEPPQLTDVKPAEFPGLHNVVAYADGFLSGSVPEGDAGYESLAKLGIQTIISVDGAQPEVDRAKRFGLRYVHLPIGYNGMSHERSLEIARAVKDLPKPIYIHCHHGKHRSAAAAGATAVALGLKSNEQAVDRMKVSGTSPNYTGLFRCVNDARPASDDELKAASNAFPESYQTSGIVQAMVEIDELHDHMKQIEAAGWVAPPNHPDLVPVAEAGRLADLFRHSSADPTLEKKPCALTERLLAESRLVQELEDGLADGKLSKSELSERWSRIAKNCLECHAQFRD